MLPSFPSNTYNPIHIRASPKRNRNVLSIFPTFFKMYFFPNSFNYYQWPCVKRVIICALHLPCPVFLFPFSFATKSIPLLVCFKNLINCFGFVSGRFHISYCPIWKARFNLLTACTTRKWPPPFWIPYE